MLFILRIRYMKKIIITIIIGVLLFNSLAIIAMPKSIENKKIITENIIISKPLIRDKENYLSIHIDEADSFFYEPGKPMIPVIIKTYQFPLGTKITNVNVFHEKHEILLPKKINPAPAPSILSNDINKKSLDLFYEKNIYESSDLYPPKIFYITRGAGLDNEEHVLFLNIRINPQY